MKYWVICFYFLIASSSFAVEIFDYAEDSDYYSVDQQEVKDVENNIQDFPENSAEDLSEDKIVDNESETTATAKKKSKNVDEDTNLVDDDGKYHQHGSLTIINKITAKSTEITAKLDEPSIYGNIEILLHKCWESKDPYWPNNYMLVSISEKTIEDDPVVLFKGWLMSDSVGISNFEHPVYEVIANKCVKAVE